GRHADRAWARPRQRFGRRRVLSRHGHHRPRSRAGHDQEGDDARSGQGRAAHARLRSALRIAGCVRRGGVQEPQEVRFVASGFSRTIAIALASYLLSISLLAQRGGAGQTARAAAPVDLTGYWVSVVTEDWRFRMVTPARGDHPSVPLNAAGNALANNWD